MCIPKEPHFFCYDIKVSSPARSWQEYLELFKGAKQARVVGETSTTYARSLVAVPSILKRMPKARFVMCLRNPVDMIASVHAQLLRGAREDVRDLADALALEPARRSGRHLPPDTLEPADLIYSNTCALGSQLARLYDNVDRERVHLVFMDDLQTNPRRVWIDIQAFLGVEDDGRTAFATENARKMPRSVTMTRILRGLHRAKFSVLPHYSLGFGARLARVLERTPKAEETAMSQELRADLLGRFATEIETLERLTGRDLSSWKKKTS